MNKDFLQTERLKVILFSTTIYIVFLSSVYLAFIDKEFRSSFRELGFAIISGCFALLSPSASSNKQLSDYDHHSINSQIDK